jgi:beta-glucoside operon transcriptional antiterminator
VEETEDNFLYEQLNRKYHEAFRCSEKIKVYLEKSYNWEISKDEVIYLTLHIHRVTQRHQQS